MKYYYFSGTNVSNNSDQDLITLIDRAKTISKIEGFSLSIYGFDPKKGTIYISRVNPDGSVDPKRKNHKVTVIEDTITGEIHEITHEDIQAKLLQDEEATDEKIFEISSSFIKQAWRKKQDKENAESDFQYNNNLTDNDVENVKKSFKE